VSGRTGGYFRRIVAFQGVTDVPEKLAFAENPKRHPYRQAMDADFGGRVTIMRLADAITSLKPADLLADTVVIVSTIQAPRVGDKEGRKVYTEDNGYLMDHFGSLKPGRGACSAGVVISFVGRPRTRPRG
jgi:hypothetical protein